MADEEKGASRPSRSRRQASKPAPEPEKVEDSPESQGTPEGESQPEEGTGDGEGTGGQGDGQDGEGSGDAEQGGETPEQAPPAPAATTAPLSPPVQQAPAPLTSSSAGAPGEGAALAAQRGGERVIDNATGEPPAVEGLFVPVVEGGTLYTCTKRLLRETRTSYDHKTLVLLIPQGGQVTKGTVDRVVGLLERA